MKNVEKCLIMELNERLLTGGISVIELENSVRIMNSKSRGFKYFRRMLESSPYYESCVNNGDAAITDKGIVNATIMSIVCLINERYSRLCEEVEGSWVKRLDLEGKKGPENGVFAEARMAETAKKDWLLGILRKGEERTEGLSITEEIDEVDEGKLNETLLKVFEKVEKMMPAFMNDLCDNTLDIFGRVEYVPKVIKKTTAFGK